MNSKIVRIKNFFDMICDSFNGGAVLIEAKLHPYLEQKFYAQIREICI